MNSQQSNSFNTKEYVKCKYDYTARRPQELSIQKGDVAILLASINDDWWKLESPIDRIGYVPANYLERVLAPYNSEFSVDYSTNPTLKQREIEDLYQAVLSQCEEKLHHLSGLHEYFSFKREIKELILWIQEANSLGITIDNQSSNLESADRSKSTFEELLTQAFETWSSRRSKTGIRLLLHHDNASAHTAAKTLDFLAENSVQLVSHPPYSPDLAPCDFFLFPTIKEKIRGVRFKSPEEARLEFEEALWSLPEEKWHSCFDSWFHRMQLCIDCCGH
ncbi:hypothetical protein LOD99_11321 [Oopsacas minuta]|uniref:SH3 domain-containing protein n=1 Tax=Oopsacas minuta TaxID=111878 RepID=A0AAV7K5B3_9METZ|nr:hypothetical protein LOD99_11321 [Oopsacas minuta]